MAHFPTQVPPQVTKFTKQSISVILIWTTRTNLLSAVTSSAASSHLVCAWTLKLGPSTYHFHPTATTKLFVSSSSIKKANALLVKKATQINNFDKFAQLRQFRSNFTIPTTYCFRRCSSRFTDNVHMRPYTVFTAFCAEEGDEFSDVKLGSSIMRFMAAVVFNQERTFSCKQLALIAPPVEKKTYVYLQYKKVLELGSVNDTITIFGNLALENILFGIAEKITPPLKELYNKAAKKILQKIKYLH